MRQNKEEQQEQLLTIEMLQVKSKAFLTKIESDLCKSKKNNLFKKGLKNTNTVVKKTRWKKVAV